MTEPTSDWGRGSWMQTFTGRQFYPLDPRPEDVSATDISHALSMICRYGGHTRRFYSVAEHCVLMSHAVPPQDALAALLHDATEAYVGDMIRPLKHHLPSYQQAEAGVWAAICRRFDFDPLLPQSVKDADNRILLDERAALLTVAPAEWSVEELQPLGVQVFGWKPTTAEQTYRERLAELGAS